MTIMTPLQVIIMAFVSYYESLKGEEHYSLPKKLKGEDYWSDVWFDFKKVEEFETFLPYLFHTGLLGQELWNVYQEEGNLSFSTIDRIVENKYGHAAMDWLDTGLDQPAWGGSKFANLRNEGASFEEFITSIQSMFEGDYLEKAKTKEYWWDYLNFSEDNIELLFSIMGIEPVITNETTTVSINEPTASTTTTITKSLTCFEPLVTVIPGVLGKSDKPWRK